MILGTRSAWTRRFQTSKSQWPNPQESTGRLYCRMSRKSLCWEAIGAAREMFLRIADEIKRFLEQYSDPVQHPVTWTIYMVGQTETTSEPMIIFCSRDLNSRKQVRKSVEGSGILEKFPGVRVGDVSRPPDFDPDGSQDIRPDPNLGSSNAESVMPQFNKTFRDDQAQHLKNLEYGYRGSPTSSPTTNEAPSLQVAAGDSANSTAVFDIVRSPGVQFNVGVTRLSLSCLPPPAPPGGANPPLIRTSTLQQTPSPATAPDPGHESHDNAYSLYPIKAKLEIVGDLDALALNWSPEDFEAKRRIINFRRSQSGGTITTTFNLMSSDDRPPNRVCISCIYWEEKREFFVTNVDVIYLLEQLVASRFTVEEKNRIRRNLECFRPLTVSMAGLDSNEFFKVIMAFPAPKPRNIEKHVKVFCWKDLTPALKKIIGKYSATPSTTLPPRPLLAFDNSVASGTEGPATGLS